MEDIRDFGAYQVATGKITDSNKLVISLSGFGAVTGEIPFESVNSFRNLSPSVLYVKDNSRSWYTNRDGLEELVSYLKSFIDSNCITDVTTYGISMGGFGAALIAYKINACRAIALSPRTLIGTICDFDHRNKEYIEKLKDIEYDDMRDLITKNTKLIVIFSIDDPFDASHAARLKNTLATVFGYRGEHNIARTLKNRGLLERFLQACLLDELDPNEFGFCEPPAEALQLGLAWITNNRSENLHQSFERTSDQFVPTYMYEHLKARWLEHYFDSLPVPFISVDSVIAFPAHPLLIAENKDIAPYLGLGWATPEDFGAWGVGKHHTINIRLTNLPEQGKVRLFLSFRVFRSTVAPTIDVSYTCNGRPPAMVTEGDGSHLVEFTCSDTLLFINIHTPNPVRPVDYGINNDSRALSVALTSIKFDLQTV